MDKEKRDSSKKTNVKGRSHCSNEELASKCGPNRKDGDASAAAQFCYSTPKSKKHSKGSSNLDLKNKMVGIV